MESKIRFITKFISSIFVICLWIFLSAIVFKDTEVAIIAIYAILAIKQVHEGIKEIWDYDK